MIRTLFFCSLLAAMPLACQAAVTYEVFFRVEGIDEIDSTRNVDVGSMLNDVQIVLRESVTGTDVPNLGANNLIGAGVAIRSAGQDAISDAKAPALSAFGSTTGTVSTTLPASENAIAWSDFVGLSASDAGNGRSEIVIGTVDLLGPTTPDSTVQFSLADRRPIASANDFDTSIGGINDSEIAFRTFSLSNITAIPEPTTFGFLMAAGCVIGLRRRRR